MLRPNLTIASHLPPHHPIFKEHRPLRPFTLIGHNRPALVPFLHFPQLFLDVPPRANQRSSSTLKQKNAKRERPGKPHEKAHHHISCNHHDTCPHRMLHQRLQSPLLQTLGHRLRPGIRAYALISHPARGCSPSGIFLRSDLRPAPLNGTFSALKTSPPYMGRQLH